MSIKLTIDKQKYTINPQLTLGEYMVLRQEKKTLNDPLKLMGILTDIPEETLRKIDIQRANYIVDKVLNKKIEQKDKQVRATFEFNGTLYGLETDLTKINFGGWVDLETFIALGHQEHMDKITAIYYRPIVSQIGKTYVLEEYDSDKMLKRAEEFRELPFEYVVGAQRFFLEFTNQFIRSITHSLTMNQKKMMRRLKTVKVMKKILPPYLHGKFVRAFITPKL